MGEITRAVETAVKDVAEHAGTRFGTVAKDFYHETGQRMVTAAENAAAMDLKHKTALENVLKNGEKDVARDARGAAVKDAEHAARPGLGSGDPLEEATPLQGRAGSKDPVDLVFGEAYLPQVDLVLPALLPVVLERMHASNYGKGRWFGPTWASTLDQRLEVDADGVHYAGPDCTVLHYPLPASGADSVLPREGARWPLTRDQATDTYRVEQPETGRTLHFPPGPTLGAVRPLGAVTDRNGHRLTFVCDESGMPVSVEHSCGYRLAVDHVETRSGRRIGAIRLLHDANPSGTTVISFRYDTLGRLMGIVNSSGVPQTFEYDLQQRVTAWVDRNNQRYEYHYDDAGRVVRSTGTGGYLTATFAYDTEGRTTTLTDSLGGVTTYHWDTWYHVVRIVDPMGGQTQIERDRYGRVLARTDPLGRTVRYTLSYDGDPVMVRRPGGGLVVVDYDRLRRPSRMVRPDGAVWRYEHDARGNLIAETDPAGEVTSHTVDERGHLVATTDAVGNTLRFERNPAGLPILVTDATGATTRIEYTPFGLPSAVTDPLGRTTRLRWTPEGKLVRREAADGTYEQWRYDGEGNLLEYRDPIGGVTGYEYGPFDKPTSVTKPSGARYTFDYDTELRLTRMTNPLGQAWQYEYDTLGRLIGETDVNGRRLTYRFDAAGQLVARTNGAGQTVRLGYDDSGRIVDKRVEGAVTTLAYDAAGRLLRAQGPDSVLEYAYDPLGRITAETVDGRTMTHEFDALGRRVRRTTPTGAASTWTYDPAGRPSSLATVGGRLAFEHDAAGQETNRYLGNGAELAQRYDAAGRVAEQTIWSRAAGGDPRRVQHRSYAFRADGCPIAIEDLLRGPRRFELDAMGHPLTVDTPAGQESYRYDPLGALVSAAAPDDTSARGDREQTGTLLHRAGRTRFDYDPQGRVVRRIERTPSGRDVQTTYAWDAEDRLIEVTVPDGGRWRYRYDPLGRRIAKQRLAADGRVATETRFAWDGTRVAEQTGTAPEGHRTAVTWDWLPQTAQAATQIERRWRGEADQAQVDTTFHAIVADLIGTPIELVSAEGAITWSASHDLWGASIDGGPGPVDCPLRFPGQYRDRETGLHYNFLRYYDPTTGSYVSPDPLRAGPAPHDHAYTANPLILADPLGLAPYGKVDLNDPNSEMAQVSMAARMDSRHTQVQSSQNVAVYRIGEPPEHTYIAAANDPRGLHSEEILNAHIADPANGISREDVTGVYSERVPCVQTSSTGSQHNCAASLNQYPNLGNDIQWSLDPDRPNLGTQNAAAIQKAMANYPGPAPGLPGFTWVG